MKGCPLKCRWCANPEGISAHRQLLYRQSKCDCTELPCAATCPRGAIEVAEPPPISIERTKCLRCETWECTEACCREALIPCGKLYSLQEVMRIVQRDRDYWGSGGGLTLSGGEPFFQEDFTGALLEECHRRYIHTAIETTASSKWFLPLMKDVDFAFVDMKHMNPQRHREGTGITNRVILQNIRELSRSGWKGTLIIRIPVIPGYNDTPENMTEAAAFLKECSLSTVNLLPFHRMGESKYRQLGLEYPFGEVSPPDAEQMNDLRRIFEKANIACHIGNDTPY